MDLIKELNKEQLAKELTPVQIGDTVRVHVKVKEGSRERIQVFEGTVIAKKHGGIAETFTVRRTSYGVGVERVFPVNSPLVEKVDVVRRGKVRRAKLFYLRELYENTNECLCSRGVRRSVDLCCLQNSQTSLARVQLPPYAR